MSARSPFARRIRLALRRLQLETEEKAVDVFDPQSELSRHNPLGMIPVLITRDQLTLSDSHNILDYLHTTTNAVWPVELAAQFQMKQASVWCVGIMQASILFFQESHMHEVPSPKWLNDHVEAIEDTCKALSNLNEFIWMQNGKLSQAAWDLSVALQYCELRIPQIKWREKYPAFVQLVELAKKDLYFLETEPKA